MCDHERYSRFEQQVEIIHACECGSCHAQDQPEPDDRELDNYIYEYDQVELPHYNAADTRLHELQERAEERRIREEIELERSHDQPAHDRHRSVAFNVHDPGFR